MSRERDPESQHFFWYIVAGLAVAALLAFPFSLLWGWGVWLYYAGLATIPALFAIALVPEGVLGWRRRE